MNIKLGVKIERSDLAINIRIHCIVSSETKLFWSTSRIQTIFHVPGINKTLNITSKDSVSIYGNTSNLEKDFLKSKNVFSFNPIRITTCISCLSTLMHWPLTMFHSIAVLSQLPDTTWSPCIETHLTCHKHSCHCHLSGIHQQYSRVHKNAKIGKTLLTKEPVSIGYQYQLHLES